MSPDYFIWAKLDEDDESMNNDSVKERLNEFPDVTVKWGLSKGKVDAVNRSMDDLPPCDIIIILSDDIKFDVFGFDDLIREAFAKHFPNLDGTVHFQEFNAKNRTIIVSMLGINLYKQIGYLFWPEYESVYPDNDFTEMTRLMGKYAYEPKIIFSHLHPIWGHVPWDEQYRNTERPEVYKRDRDIFNKRKASNFGL